MILMQLTAPKRFILVFLMSQTVDLSNEIILTGIGSTLPKKTIL